MNNYRTVYVACCATCKRYGVERCYSSRGVIDIVSVNGLCDDYDSTLKVVEVTE